MLNDGRRQISAFYFPGDIFGLETGEEHTFSAEAITDSKVLVIKRSTVVSLAARDNEVARQLWTLTSRELRRVQDHILLLIKTAEERVVSFLLEMAARRPGANTVELPMSRQDIADYLGLTIETVSRTLSQLEDTATIELPSSIAIDWHTRCWRWQPAAGHAFSTGRSSRNITRRIRRCVWRRIAAARSLQSTPSLPLATNPKNSCPIVS